MASDAIQLDDALLIGKGLHRFCYRHPADPSLCIKVRLDDSARCLKEINRELRFYRFLEGKRDSHNLDGILPRYHGKVETSAGEGHIFDLILDHDGEVSKPLSFYLRNDEGVGRYGPLISEAYQPFRDNASQGSLITMALKPYNILLQMRGRNDYGLVIVDSLGSANLIPGAYLSRYLARAKMQRHLVRFERLLEERFGFVIAPAQSTTHEKPGET